MQGVEVSRMNGRACARRRKSWACAVLGVLAAVCGAPVGAQLTIEITSFDVRPVPMAVVPFGWQGAGAAPFDIASVVTSDLRNSGRFAPIAPTDMVSRPTQPAQVNFQDWRVVDVDVLVIGQLTEDSPDRFTAVFQLFDVLRGEQLLAFRLTAGRQDLRATAHRISDMIFEELTGIPGVFGTQIAYVSEERRADNTRTFRLIVADADGENPRVIAESPQPLMSPSWSPDSRRIAYVSFEGDQSAVYVQTLAHRHARSRVGKGRSEQLAGVFPGRAPARVDSVARSGKLGRVYVGLGDASVAAVDQRCSNRYRGRLVAGQPHDLLHVGPVRQPADLSRRRGARRTGRARHVRRHLQCAPARLARRQAASGHDSRS